MKKLNENEFQAHDSVAFKNNMLSKNRYASVESFYKFMQRNFDYPNFMLFLPDGRTLSQGISIEARNQMYNQKHYRILYIKYDENKNNILETEQILNTIKNEIDNNSIMWVSPIRIIDESSNITYDVNSFESGCDLLNNCNYTAAYVGNKVNLNESVKSKKQIREACAKWQKRLNEGKTGKYTAKQIRETIKYWKNKLNESIG